MTDAITRATDALETVFSATWADARRAEEARERHDMSALRARLVDAARVAGAGTITARYEGGGDSGAIDSISAAPDDADGALDAVTLATPARVYDEAAKAYVDGVVETPFFDAAKTFLSWALTARVGNWWDGSETETEGDIVWHVAETPDRLSGEHIETVRRRETEAWDEADDDPDVSGDDDAGDGPSDDGRAESLQEG